MIADVSPGGYTAIVRGHGDAIGTALVELYDLTAPRAPAAFFSFENGLEGWMPKATDVYQPPVYWAIEPSQDRATVGSTSLRFALNNLTDAGKVWIERAFSVRPNRAYHVNVEFSFATSDFGDVNNWSIIAGVRKEPAATRSDVKGQGTTGNASSSDVGYLWLEKSYDFDITSAADGNLYVDVGVWGTWETFRAYYIDNLRVTISEP